MRSMHYLFISVFASGISLSIHVVAMENVCFSSEWCLYLDLADVNLKDDESVAFNYIVVEP